jgi:hypothetical protein
MNKLNKPEKEEKDIDSLLEYILENQSEKLTKLTNLKNFSLYMGHFSILACLFILIFRANFLFSYSYPLIFALISIISYSISLNIYLKLQDLIQDEILKLKNEQTFNIGSLLSYLSFNIIGLCLCFYLILITLRLEGVLPGSNWNTLAVPMFISCGICLFYIIFILPAFLTNRLYMELGTIFVYFISAFVFLILFNLKLDKELDITFMKAFMPLIIAFSLNFGFCLILLFAKGNNLKGKFLYLCSVVILLTISIITPLKLDEIVILPGWVCVLLLFFAVFLLTYEDLSGLFISQEEEEIFDGVV